MGALEVCYKGIFPLTTYHHVKVDHNSANKILSNKFSHVPVAHRCQTRLKSKLCSLFWVCRRRDNRARLILSRLCQTHSSSPVVRWLDSGHVCVWNYVQLDHINQWESCMGSKGKPLFSFSLFGPLNETWLNAWTKTAPSWYDCDLMTTGRK